MPSRAASMPADAADQRLRAHVHPPDWINPEPRDRYHLVVVGGGTAGLVSAMGAAGLGARVALVERDLLGGDCLVTGCVPSKAVLRSARAAAEARQAQAVGVRVSGIDADFAAVMRRMRERRADISPHDSAARLRAAGVDVYFGEARFASASSVEVGGRTLRFKRAVIATGGRPARPPIPGLSETPYLTSETVFALDLLPPRLAVIGAGPIGCELAQALARLGAAVTMIDQARQVLPQEDADAAAVVAGRLEAEGVRLELGAGIAGVRREGERVALRLERKEAEVVCDQLLVATGRTPNLEPLDLAAAGIAADKDGVTVDDHLRTTNPRVFAAGDVCSRFKFTHAADAMARIVIQNALFFGRARASALVIPWCTYTDPEVAHVGWYAGDARMRGHQVDTVTVRLDEVDRAVVDEERDGFVRLHHERGRLLGCTVVAARAGEMIALPAYALRRRATLDDLGATITPYPTVSNAFRAAADAHRRTRLTPRVRAWLARYFRLM